MEFSKKRILCVCGHYGVGKTNVSVALAKALKASGLDSVTLLDFDIVNPYFRSADNAEELTRAGVEVILPEYANSNVDLPTIPPQVNRVFETNTTAVFDVGGDDSGATALGGFHSRIEAAGYELYVVVNACRPYISTPEEALEMIFAIEQASLLKATGIINNTNLKEETDVALVRDSFAYANAICQKSGLPLVATTVAETLVQKFTDEERETHKIFPIGDATKKIF